MLPRLHARAQLAAVDAAALAAGGFEPFAQMRMMERLRRAARGETDRARAPRIGDAEMAAMGIGVRIVEPGEKASGHE